MLARGVGGLALFKDLLLSSIVFILYILGAENFTFDFKWVLIG
jgi:hypothetical protein